jgi:hypothetical protein
MREKKTTRALIPFFLFFASIDICKSMCCTAYSIFFNHKLNNIF